MMMMMIRDDDDDDDDDVMMTTTTTTTIQFTYESVFFNTCILSNESHSKSYLKKFYYKRK
jgi:hypothetical protein